MWADREQPHLALRLEPRRNGGERVARLERRPEPRRVVPEEEQDRRQRRRAPASATTRPASGAAPRPGRRPAAARRTGSRARAAPASGTPHRRAARSATRAASRSSRSGSASVSSVAISWPVCQTPPRVVIHQIWVEKPSSSTSQNRSTSDRTFSRPSSHQRHPDRRRGEDRVDRGLEVVGGDRPDDRDERHERDRRERRERHEDLAVLDDHVVGAGREVHPDAAVEEGVGEVEEVAAWPASKTRLQIQ